MDLSTKVTEWRARIAAGEQLTMEEMREAIQFLRAGRKKATVKAKKKGTSKKVVNSDDLLKELEGL